MPLSGGRVCAQMPASRARCVGLRTEGLQALQVWPPPNLSGMLKLYNCFTPSVCPTQETWGPESSPLLSRSRTVAAVHGALQSVPVVTWPALHAGLECSHVARGLLHLVSSLGTFSGLAWAVARVRAAFLRQRSQCVCSSFGRMAVPIGGFAGRGSCCSARPCSLVWVCRLLCAHAQE